MHYRVYLMDIEELADDALAECAGRYSDSDRQQKIKKCKNKKGRMQQIATGLLLQVGLMEPELPRRHVQDDGVLYLCGVEEAMALLDTYRAEYGQLPATDVVYESGNYGKPYWYAEFLRGLPKRKGLPYFNVSHSGFLAGIVIADTEVGLDIQEARSTRYMAWDYRKFSRLEAYSKCTGRGVLRGYTEYRQSDSFPEDIRFYEFDVKEGYAINLCSMASPKKEDEND